MKTLKRIAILFVIAFLMFGASCRSGYQPVGCPKFSISSEIQYLENTIVDKIQNNIK